MSPTAPRVLNASLLLTVVTLLFLLVGRLQAADPVLLTAPAYINVGGAAIADVQGNLWLADQAFGASQAYGYVDFSSADSVGVGGPGIAVSGTDNDLVYGSGREGMDAYVVNLPNGTYDLTLHFSEVSGATTGGGQRVFDVFVEGEHVLAALDIYAAVGPQAASSKLVAGVEVTDAQLKMVFVALQGLATLSGISIVEVAIAPVLTTSPTPTLGPTPTPVPPPQAVIRVNVGGGDYVDADGNLWQGDAPFTAQAGWGYIDDGHASVVDRRTGDFWLDIAGTSDDAVFAMARNAVDRYDFNVPAGTYAIDLLFTETEISVPVGGRLFDVTFQGVTVLDDFDILATAGGYDTAVTQRIELVSASGGVITLRLLTASGGVDTELLPIGQRPEISGMVIWVSTPPAPPLTPTPTPSPTPTATPSPTPSPTPTPVLPTPTPPLGGGTPSPTSPGGGAFFPGLVPTATPTPTPTLTPTAAPAPGGALGFVGGSGSNTGSSTGTVLSVPTPSPTPATTARARFDLALATANGVVVTLSADAPASGFSLAIDVPLGAFAVESIELSAALVDAGFDGRPRVDEASSQVVLSGGFPTPIALDGTLLMTIHLTPRHAIAAGAYNVAIVQALVRDAVREPMDMDGAFALVLVVDLPSLADVNDDGAVDPTDLALLALAYGSVDGDADYDTRVDLNGDGRVDLRDLALLGAGNE